MHRTAAPSLKTLRIRQLIFSALAKGLDAGLTPGASLKTVLTEGDRQPTQKIIQSLQGGKSVAETFQTHRLGSNFDLSLVRIGETSGRLAAVAQFIADRYQRIIEQKRRLRAKLSLPLFIGFFAIVVMPLPNIIAGTLDPMRYLLYVLLIGLMSLTTWWLIRFFFVKHSSTATAYPAHRFIGIPLIDELLEDYSTASFCERLHLLFASGYPIIDAIQICHESLVGFARRRRYKQLEHDLRVGYSVADAFEHHEILRPMQLPILATGEAAGRLEESLARIANDTRTRFDSKIDLVVTWFPRLVYLLITVAVVSKIL